MISATEVSDLLVKMGINMVAVDFDGTLIRHHTHGAWQGASSTLVESVRDVFKQLLSLLNDRGAIFDFPRHLEHVESDICLSIVTFSPQTQLITEVIRSSFPAFCQKILIRTRDGSWGNPGDWQKDGKQKFMASAAQEFEKWTNKEITRNTTLLIDDDPSNIRIALNGGVRAIFFDPEKPERLFDDIEQMAKLHFENRYLFAYTIRISMS